MVGGRQGRGPLVKSRNNGQVIVPIRGADVARILAYSSLAAFAAVIFFFPPTSFSNALETSTRAMWCGTAAIGAVMAVVGVITRRDLKVEFPGLHVMLLGPAFYAFAQFWYILNPNLTALAGAVPTSPSQRYALAAFAVYGTLMILPRLLELRDTRRQTRLARTGSVTDEMLTEAQAAQPGAFPEFERRDTHDDEPDSAAPRG